MNNGSIQGLYHYHSNSSVYKLIWTNLTMKNDYHVLSCFEEFPKMSDDMGMQVTFKK